MPTYANACTACDHSFDAVQSFSDDPLSVCPECDGRLRKGLFANNSLGKSKTLDYLTYKLKGEFSYRFSGAHAIDANVAYMVNPPQFRDAFVSARTRNTTTPGLDSEKVLGVDLLYNLNLP